MLCFAVLYCCIIHRNTIEQLSDQLRGVRNAQEGGSGREEHDEAFQLVQTECQQLQSQCVTIIKHCVSLLIHTDLYCTIANT